MKTSIILLLILLAGTACTPQPTAVPLVNPNPIPVTGAPPVATDIPVTTSLPPCTCPTGVVPPAGSVSPEHIVCTCPVILVPPPAPTGGLGSSPQAIPAGGITLADNGNTFIVHPGDSFLLNLGMDTFDWTVTIDNQNIISREKNVMPIRGAQGVYQASTPGQAVLSAVGDPLCRNSTPACMSPSILFQVTLIVQ